MGFPLLASSLLSLAHGMILRLTASRAESDLESKSLTEGWKIPLMNLKLIEYVNSDSTAELAETRESLHLATPLVT